MERVWRQYLLRVAYLALTRILLYRSWEDVGFRRRDALRRRVRHGYERLNESVREVLRRAFTRGRAVPMAVRPRTTTTGIGRARRRSWTFSTTWAPSRSASSTRTCSGSLYVSYVDEIDRDRLGSSSRRASVVRFMLDRAGFKAPEDVFRLEGNERQPLAGARLRDGLGRVPGRGGPRIIEEAGIGRTSPRGSEALRAISSGFHGGEISPFPYYLTEINLLLQVSRLLGRMRVGASSRRGFVLGCERIYSSGDERAGSTSRRSCVRRAPSCPHDDIYDVCRLSPRSTARFASPPGRRVRPRDRQPAVRRGGEQQDAVPALSARFRNGRAIYRGKTDYLYYFLLLALEKLKPGGKLCVITPAGWMNAGSADFLRERVGEWSSTLEELFLFGSLQVVRRGSRPGADAHRRERDPRRDEDSSAEGAQASAVVALEDDVVL